MRKKHLSFIITSLALLWSAAACQKPECQTCQETKSSLTIKLEGDETKSTTTLTQAEDNKINSVDIFIFRNTDATSADYQKLDTYKRFSGGDLSTLTLETTTGPKTICVVINEHTNGFGGVTNLSKFRALVANLKDELVGSYTMYGELESNIDVTSSVSITVTRLISRVGITSIKTKFAGSPYEGKTLSNVKLFLVNAHANKLIYSGTPPPSPLIYNQSRLVPEDANATTEANLIFEPVTNTINDTPLVKSFYFYCYSNETNDTPSCTKLVVQGDLDGTTYYYPILINQVGYGYDTTNGHYGVKRNTTYSYGITITRPGTLNPNTPLVPGSLELSISVKDWDVIPHFDKQF